MPGTWCIFSQSSSVICGKVKFRETSVKTARLVTGKTKNEPTDCLPAILTSVPIFISVLFCCLKISIKMFLSPSPFGTRGVREHGKRHRCYAHVADTDRALHVPLNALTISVPTSRTPNSQYQHLCQGYSQAAAECISTPCIVDQNAQELTQSPVQHSLGMALKQHLPDVGMDMHTPDLLSLARRILK